MGWPIESFQNFAGNATIMDYSCMNYVQHEYARVKIKIQDSSYLRRVQSLKYSDADKFAIIGGTLGLFTGFSFIVIFELAYWVIITIKKVYVLTLKKPSVKSKKGALSKPNKKEEIQNDVVIIEMSEIPHEPAKYYP